MQNPKEAGPKPKFDERSQDHPGSESRMKLKPDHGEQSYKGLGRLSGRVALVTGADSGIGRAVALAFAREGADVAIAYLNEQTDADGIERTFHVNVMAMFHITKAALKYMKPGGAIINSASIQAYDPSPSILDYASTKGAIVTFTKGLAQELTTRGIRVNAVAPGPVWTPLVAQSFDEKALSKFGESTPMQRPAQPVELAPAYVFLACDESRYVSGEILGVTGGRPLA